MNRYRAEGNLSKVEVNYFLRYLKIGPNNESKPEWLEYE